jgi:hypothetical protein
MMMKCGVVSEELQWSLVERGGGGHEFSSHDCMQPTDGFLHFLLAVP